VEGKRGERGCRTWTISVLQDARRQSHEVTESITVTSFTLRLILQFYVLNFVASLKEKTKGPVFQVAKRLTTRQLQWNSGWLLLVLQWRFNCRHWKDRVRCGDDNVWFVGKNLKWGGSKLLESRPTVLAFTCSGSGKSQKLQSGHKVVLTQCNHRPVYDIWYGRELWTNLNGDFGWNYTLCVSCKQSYSNTYLLHTPCFVKHTVKPSENGIQIKQETYFVGKFLCGRDTKGVGTKTNLSLTNGNSVISTRRRRSRMCR